MQLLMKKEHPYYELALMEDEYDISCRDILKVNSHYKNYLSVKKV